MINHQILPLDRIDLADAAFVGSKAATLGWLMRSGLPVPPGFVIASSVFRQVVEDNGLADRICRIGEMSGSDVSSDARYADVAAVQAALRHGPIDRGVLVELEHAYSPFASGAVVVRSSAIDEDRVDASFAGQHLTVLNVRSFAELRQAIGEVWASLFSESARRYRARRSVAVAGPAIALIVQAQVDCDVSGTLFTVDPVHGHDAIVVEGCWGLGEAVAQGEVVPDRFRIDRDSLGFVDPPRLAEKLWRRIPDSRVGTRLTAVPKAWRRRPVLDANQLAVISLLGLKIEELAEAPQDVEWGLARGRWWVFQARPITVRSEQPTDTVPSAEIEWTSGFLDERLVEPVSPLGWSVLRTGLEDLAFREPLRMLGVDPLALEPLTRRWNGHPYARVGAFEALYKLFPRWLLPEDARRFFPNGDVSRRRHAPWPRSFLDPKVWQALLRTLASDPLAISPLHNAATWQRFEGAFRASMSDLSHEIDAIESAPVVELAKVVGLIDAVEKHNRRLLAIHRWSLTLAEVCYSFLRRAARVLLGAPGASAYCAEVVANLGDESVRMNAAVANLRDLARRDLDDDFATGFGAFLAEFGHRSFSLDLIRPSFGAEPGQILALLRDPVRENDDRSPENTGSPPCASEGSTTCPGSRTTGASRAGLRVTLLAPFAELTRRYARLREDQRFAWQRGLALLRRLYLLAGRSLVERGMLDEAGDVFFLTAEEIAVAARAPVPSLRRRAAVRSRQYKDDRARFSSCPSESYPPFLIGDRPLRPDVDDESRANRPNRYGRDGSGFGTSGSEGNLCGEPVSHGIGRGRARVVARPEDLAAIRPGEVLVTRGVDPGWTAVFDRLAGLIAERGGQLSHASVVAREYRLPAVVAVAGATAIIRTGDLVVVDGGTGLVRLLSREA